MGCNKLGQFIPVPGYNMRPGSVPDRGRDFAFCLYLETASGPSRYRKPLSQCQSGGSLKMTTLKLNM